MRLTRYLPLRLSRVLRLGLCLRLCLGLSLGTRQRMCRGGRRLSLPLARQWGLLRLLLGLCLGLRRLRLRGDLLPGKRALPRNGAVALHGPGPLTLGLLRSAGGRGRVLSGPALLALRRHGRTLLPVRRLTRLRLILRQRVTRLRLRLPGRLRGRHRGTTGGLLLCCRALRIAVAALLTVLRPLLPALALLSPLVLKTGLRRLLWLLRRVGGGGAVVRSLRLRRALTTWSVLPALTGSIGRRHPRRVSGRRGRCGGGGLEVRRQWRQRLRATSGAPRRTARNAACRGVTATGGG